MKEAFIHYVWSKKYFVLNNLRTSSNEELFVLHFGEQNEHDGPDFQSGIIRISGITWAGQIEMHVKASDWYIHGHDRDRKYDNVILHVVWEEDKPVFQRNGKKLPCLELKNRISKSLLSRYESLAFSSSWIPCANQIGSIRVNITQSQIRRALLERMNIRGLATETQMKSVHGHWGQLIFQIIAGAFGLKFNREAFEYLSASIPVELIYKSKPDVLQLEALLFGQAGFLSDKFKDAYPKALLSEYRFLKHKYKLNPISVNFWKFKQLRPSNFPTIRLAQFACFLHKPGHLFSFLIEKPIDEITSIFDEICASEYWDTHYVFDKLSRHRIKNMGASAAASVLINGVAPFLFYYGEASSNPHMKEKANNLLKSLPPEKNAITAGWERLQIRANSALDSQGLIQLKTYHCDENKCLHCGIGQFILKG